jgi:hypothetical protein
MRKKLNILCRELLHSLWGASAQWVNVSKCWLKIAKNELEKFQLEFKRNVNIF